MSRLQELSEINAANYTPEATWIFAENSESDSKKIKASTVLKPVVDSVQVETAAREGADESLADDIAANEEAIGTLADLSTASRTDLVTAINEVASAVEAETAAREGAINSLDAASVGGAGKYIESISEANGIITAVEKSFGSIAKSNATPVTGGAVWAYSQILASHNIPRYVNGVLGKDITAYYNDGTLWKRLNGTNGFMLFEDVYAGDYFQMSRAITCPDSYQGDVGSGWVTIGGIDTLMGNGDQNDVNYHHLVIIPGKGEKGLQHFGRHAMNDTNTTAGGYVGSKMHTDVLGAVVSAGSTASGATINQQLYAEFGAHLKTTRELLSKSINASGYNRLGSANGCSSDWGWTSCQAVLMSEAEAYGSIVWSSSGYDTGTAKTRLPLFMFSTASLNNRSAYYWLKDVASASIFCHVSDNGDASCHFAGNTSLFVRPRFVLAA